MRFVMHRTIASDVFNDRGVFAFRFGCVAPDYAKWDRIHRTKETYDRTMDWYVSLQGLQMPRNRKADFMMGMVCHFICDYCCHAHWDDFYSFIGHRIYEVELQKFYLKHRREILAWYEEYRASAGTLYEEFNKEPGREIREFLLSFLNRLNDENNGADDGKWYRSEKIMMNDIKAAYMSLDLLFRVERRGAVNG